MSSNVAFPQILVLHSFQLKMCSSSLVVSHTILICEEACFLSDHLPFPD